MTTKRYSKIWMITIFCFCLSAGVSALDKEEYQDRRQEARYSMLGLRLGAWADQGDGEVIPTEDEISADFPSTSFFTEIFYDHRFSPFLMGEISLGVGSRGEATITHAGDDYIGTITLYPLLLQVKLSPFSGKSLSFHPYITGGGGLVFGRHNTQFIRSQDNFYDQYFAEKTEIAFVPTFGGGIDLALNEQFGLNLSVKYYPISFSDGLAGVEDYSGLSIAVGFSYHVYKKKK